MFQLTRRGFLGLFGAAGVVAATNPTYFFAPIGGWHSDIIVSPEKIEGESIYYDQLMQGGLNRYTLKTYAISLVIQPEFELIAKKLLAGAGKPYRVERKLWPS